MKFIKDTLAGFLGLVTFAIVALWVVRVLQLSGPYLAAYFKAEWNLTQILEWGPRREKVYEWPAKDGWTLTWAYRLLIVSFALAVLAKLLIWLGAESPRKEAPSLLEFFGHSVHLDFIVLAGFWGVGPFGNATAPILSAVFLGWIPAQFDTFLMARLAQYLKRRDAERHDESKSLARRYLDQCEKARQEGCLAQLLERPRYESYQEWIGARGAVLSKKEFNDLTDMRLETEREEGEAAYQEFIAAICLKGIENPPEEAQFIHWCAENKRRILLPDDFRRVYERAARSHALKAVGAFIDSSASSGEPTHSDYCQWAINAGLASFSIRDFESALYLHRNPMEKKVFAVVCSGCHGSGYIGGGNYREVTTQRIERDSPHYVEVHHENSVAGAVGGRINLGGPRIVEETRVVHDPIFECGRCAGCGRVPVEKDAPRKIDYSSFELPLKPVEK